MVRELLTLPVRVSVRVAGLWLRVAEDAASRVMSVGEQLLHTGAANGREPSPLRTPPMPERPPAEPVIEGIVHEARTVEPRLVEPEPPAVARDEPEHVSEEPVLVEALAEAGAEEGAGAEVRIAEPWDGYSRMPARDVIERFAVASAAELAAVQLYESGHRRRTTVVSAAERELRRRQRPTSNR